MGIAALPDPAGTCIALVGLDTKALPLDVEELLEKASAMLPEAYASGRVTALRLPQP